MQDRDGDEEPAEGAGDHGTLRRPQLRANQIVEPAQIAAVGIGRTFQNIRLFSQLTVWQNLWAARVVRESGWAGLRERWFAPASKGREQAEAMLEFCGLQHKRDMLAGNLAFGEQRRLELARAAISGAPLLLLDEPAAGMNAAKGQ